MNPILIQTERCCAMLAYSSSVSASINTVTVYQGLDNREKEAPAIICAADSATKDFNGTSVWRVRTEIIVAEMAADTALDAKGVISGVINQAFLNQNTVNNLNNQSPNWFVYDVIAGDNRNIDQGDSWVQILPLEIICTLKT